MAWSDDGRVVGDSITERGFVLDVDGRQVPGVSWEPVDGPADRLVLLGHGGSGHKKVDYIELIAHGVCGLGMAAMAIDGPGHGDRPGASDYGDGLDDFAQRWEADGGADGAVSDWKAALDFIEGEHRIEGEHGIDGEHRRRPTGYLGYSMGTMMGLPVCAADERVKVAVLGLMGVWGPAKKELVRDAPKVSIPLRFLVQWDDEVVPRDACFDLYGALGTTKKTMHVNPGTHAALPIFEAENAVRYLDDQLARLL